MANYFTPHIGGVENSINYLSKEYIKLGYNVIILISDSGLAKKDRLPVYEKVNNSLEIYRFRTYFPRVYLDYLLKFPLELLRIKKIVSFLMNNKSIKKIISRHWITSLGVIISGNKVTYVVPGIAINQDLLTEKDIKSKIINLLVIKPQILLQKFALKKSKLIVFSRNMKNQIIDFLNNKNHIIEVYNPGVDCDKFDSKTIPNIREKYNIPEDSFIFLVVGRLIKDKGIQYAIDALSLLETKNTFLLIVGDGPERNFLENLAQELNINNRVIFTGKIKTHIENFYFASNCFLMTSVKETFGQTILEALASGLPVIGWESGGGVSTATSEIIKNDINGYLIDFNQNKLIIAMDKISNSSSDEINKFRLKNKELVMKKYSWNLIASKLIN